MRTADRPTKHGHNFEMKTYENGTYTGATYAPKKADLIRYAKEHGYQLPPQAFSDRTKAANRAEFKRTGPGEHTDKGDFLEKRVGPFVLRYWKQTGRISTKWPKCYFVNVWDVNGNLKTECVEADTKAEAARKAAIGCPYKYSDTPRPKDEPTGTLWIKSVEIAFI
jgi:hypothetical protein